MLLLRGHYYKTNIEHIGYCMYYLRSGNTQRQVTAACDPLRCALRLQAALCTWKAEMRSALAIASVILFLPSERLEPKPAPGVAGHLLVDALGYVV